jgi:putative methyltransferase (TIGR04325 family)
MSLLIRFLNKVVGIVKPPATIKRYATFVEAKANCTGYEDESIATIVAQKTIQFVNNVNASEPTDKQWLQNLEAFQSVMQQAGNHSLTVIDFGGGCGVAFFQIAFKYKAAINRWIVLETEVMVKVANSQIHHDQLQFSSSYDEVARSVSQNTPVLLFAQGVFNFIEHPFEILKKFMHHRFSYIYITRTSFTDDQENYIYKFEAPLGAHGPGVLQNIQEKKTSYPLTVLSGPAFNSLVIQNGYTIAREFKEGEEFLTKKNKVKVCGFLLYAK